MPDDKTPAHSPGRLRAVYGSDDENGNPPADIVSVTTGHPVAHVLRVDKAAGGDYAANAQRFVACWNACEGIADPTAVADLLSAVYLLVRAVLPVGNEKQAEAYRKQAEAYRAGLAAIRKATDNPD